jgi:hypothetical protein
MIRKAVQDSGSSFVLTHVPYHYFLYASLILIYLCIMFMFYLPHVPTRRCTALQNDLHMSTSEDQHLLTRAHIGQGLLDSRLALEIYPTLRRMAVYEKKKEMKKSSANAAAAASAAEEETITRDSLADVATDHAAASNRTARQTQTRLRRRAGTRRNNHKSQQQDEPTHYFDTKLKSQYYKDKDHKSPQHKHQEGKQLGDMFASKMLQYHTIHHKE